MLVEDEESDLEATEDIPSGDDISEVSESPVPKPNAS
jgi:hypothetical protein